MRSIHYLEETKVIARHGFTSKPYPFNGGLHVDVVLLKLTNGPVTITVPLAHDDFFDVCRVCACLPVCSSVQRIGVPSGYIHVVWLRSILAIHAANNLSNLFLNVFICHSLNAISLVLCQSDKEDIGGGILWEESRGVQVLPGAAREGDQYP